MLRGGLLGARRGRLWSVEGGLVDGGLVWGFGTWTYEVKGREGDLAVSEGWVGEDGDDVASNMA